MSNYEKTVEEFSLALTRLEDALAQPQNDFMRDAAIQRFEFTLDLAWKATKKYLKDVHGVESNSPKSCFRDAFQVGLLDYDDTWIELVDKRNETVHTYKEEMAKEVFSLLPKAATLFRSLLTSLQK